MKTFSTVLNEVKSKKLVVKAKKYGDRWEIVNNILPDIVVDVWHNHSEVDYDGKYLATGGQEWGYDTPYEFKKFTNYNNRKKVNTPKDIWDFGTDLSTGYLDWRKNETRGIINDITKSLEWWLKAYLDEKGIPYQHNFNKYYLYYRKTNSVHAASKTKSAKWIKNLKDYGLPKYPDSYGSMEVISYEEATKLKAENLDYFKNK